MLGKNTQSWVKIIKLWVKTTTFWVKTIKCWVKTDYFAGLN